MFVILSVFMVLSSIATVVSKSIIRAATYLLFVLLGTAGIYFLLGYTFLGAVQIMVYAGGIVVLYVFSILLTSGQQEKLSKNTVSKVVASA
jgi:NADH-quinone oxidoreductase subunit J